MLRKRQAKNMLALLMLSAGAPMIRMGDEFLQTQLGNNNPYNQDNATSWLDWRRLEAHADLFRFCRMMIEFRKQHPSIARSQFWHDDIHWYGVEHAPDLSESSRTLAYCLHGVRGDPAHLYVMINAYWHPLQFGIHEGAPGRWSRVIDTFRASPDDIVVPTAANIVTDRTYTVGPRSVVVLCDSHDRRIAVGAKD